MFDPAAFITPFDWVLALVYISVIILFAWAYIRYFKKDNPVYRWFIPALLLKFLGGISVICIYAYYYKGGDIFAYFTNTVALIDLTPKEPWTVLQFLAGDNSESSAHAFDYSSDIFYHYLYVDHNTWAVSRFSYPFALLGFNRVLPADILMNVVGFIGPWKLFKSLYNRYPSMKKIAGFALLLIPSSIFWGSGLYKDSYTYSASLWMFYSAIAIVFEKRRILINILLILVNAYVLISIKPYVFIALMPAILVLFLFSSVQNIRNKAVRVLVLPVSTVVLLFGGIYLYTSLSPSLGKYGSIDSTIEKIVVSRSDFVNNVTYSENYFDIGEVEPTFMGLISKAPLALWYGFFGPFPWQVKSPVMAMSSLEGLTILIFFIMVLRKWLRNKAAKNVFSDPVIISFLMFSIVFMIFVGISTANFGSLVRYRIPAVTLFAFVLAYILRGSAKDKITD